MLPPDRIKWRICAKWPHVVWTTAAEGRAAMWTRVWLTLAAVETERMAPQGRGASLHAGCCQRDATDGVRPPWIFPVYVVSQSVRVQQRTVEQPEEVPQLTDGTVEAVTMVPRERVQRRVADRIGDVPQFREETVDEEAPETASQDLRLQRTVERSLVDHVEAAKIALQERISERMCEQFGVIEVSKNSSQEGNCREHS